MTERVVEPSEGSQVPSVSLLNTKSPSQSITLRNCGHLFGIIDMIQHIQKEILAMKRSPIICPLTDCKQTVHENDIDWTLDPLESSYDGVMSRGDRVMLLYQHHKQQIIEALGGPDLTRTCPICLNVYGEREGCHLVECPVRRCRTRFCWDCGQITDSLQHFTRIFDGKCRLGSDDLEKWSFIYNWLNNGSRLSTMVFTPILPFLLIFVMPILIMITVPFAVFQRQMNKSRLAEFDELTKEEVQLAQFKALGQCVLSLPLAIILGVSSLGSAPFLFGAYMMVASVMMWTGKLSRALAYLGYLLNCVGLGALHKMIEQTVLGEAEIRRRQARTQHKKQQQQQSSQKEKSEDRLSATTPKTPITPKTPVKKEKIMEKPKKRIDRKAQVFTKDFHL